MITINNIELGEEIRTILLEFVNKAGGETKYVEELCDILDERLVKIDILKEEVLLDFVNYLNKSLKGNINETVNIMWISSQLTNYLKENDL